MSNFNVIRPDTPDVDDLLRKYFQREMPQPWPKCPQPAPARPRQLVSLWSRRLPRLALAASVALLLIGYLTLARAFPQPDAGSEILTPGFIIGSKPGRSVVPIAPGKVDRVRTPRGTDVEVLEETTDGGRDVVITIQAVPPPKGGR